MIPNKIEPVEIEGHQLKSFEVRRFILFWVFLMPYTDTYTYAVYMCTWLTEYVTHWPNNNYILHTYIVSLFTYLNAYINMHTWIFEIEHVTKYPNNNHIHIPYTYIVYLCTFVNTYIVYCICIYSTQNTLPSAPITIFIQSYSKHLAQSKCGDHEAIVRLTSDSEPHESGAIRSIKQ